eukprot:1272487-Ditylum_brightwellii.AAC.1
MDAGREKIYWCYASTDVIRKYNCTLHSAINDCLDFVWCGIRPSINQLIPWVCVIYPYTHDTKDLTLRHTEGYYVGITNSSSLAEWYDPITKIVKHCNTDQFDEYRKHVGNDNPMSGALAIGGKPVATSNLPSLIINTSDHP